MRIIIFFSLSVYYDDVVVVGAVVMVTVCDAIAAAVAMVAMFIGFVIIIKIEAYFDS